MSPHPMNAPAAPDTRRDRLKQLRAFCEAVRLGSLSAAARAMESSQPVVSNHVRTLEEELGAALFLRQGARIVPTRVGWNLYRIALPLVEGLLRLPAMFDEHHHGVGAEHLRIGAGQTSAAYLLPDIVKRYLKLHSRTRVEVIPGAGRQRLDLLRRFEVDLIVSAFDNVPDDITFHPFLKSDAVIITPRDHPLGRHESVGFGALGSHAMVALKSGHYMRQFQDVVLRIHGAHPRIVLEIDGWNTMVRHVAAGVGVALVPDVCAIEHERICRVRVSHSFRIRNYGLAVRRGGPMGLAVRRFLDVALSAPAGAQVTP